ncbi:MAG: hypothetical protein RSE41_07845 [Clostridia bacterium]
MKKFDKIYKKQAEEARAIKESKIEKDFEQIYRVLLTEWEISDPNTLSDDNKKSFDSVLEQCWNIKEGLTSFGSKFINEKFMFLNESSTNEQRKNFITKKFGDNIKYVINNSNIKDNLYEIIDECVKQVKQNTLNETIEYNDLEEAITSQVNKHIKAYFEPILDELRESYK